MNQMIDAYDDYLTAYHDSHYINSVSKVAERKCHELELMIKNSDDGGLPLRPTSHSLSRFSTRVEHLVSSNSIVHEDVIVNGGCKLLLPANMFLFMSEKILESRISGSYSSENGGYKYKTKIEEWSDSDTSIEMIAFVEGGSIKTVFFNIVSAE